MKIMSDGKEEPAHGDQPQLGGGGLVPAAGDGGVEQLPALAGPGVVTRGADVPK